LLLQRRISHGLTLPRSLSLHNSRISASGEL
jgi:hypothetical protein